MDFSGLLAKVQQMKDYIEGEDIKDMVGREAVDHYKESFKNEGFTDETLEPWKDVERRDPESDWYGHNYPVSKFSKERSTAKILKGKTSELRESIGYDKTENGVKITNATPYARVHQFGLPAKIYGKKAFVMPARPFMGDSKVLKQKIKDNIRKKFNDIMKG